jgi:choline dehydrogenase-like flavoprotein
MITDLNDLPNGTVVDADIAIVGAGPAGIALASELRATNLQVVLVESGGLEIESSSQELNEADSIGLLHRERKAGRARALGGAAKLWYGQCLPLDDIDFRPRSWVPSSGWPFGPEHLGPYYRRAQKFFRVEGEAYDAEVYKPFHIEPPNWLPGKLRSMATAYTPDVDSGQVWKGRLEAAANLRVLLHANVTNIAVNAAGSAFSHLDIRSLEGREARVRAQVAVLCTGGLENARLLLLSRRQQPGGLGNARGLVGRFFQEHPNGFTGDVIADDRTAKLLQQKFRLLYGKNGIRHFPKFRLSEQAQESEQVLNCNASLLFEYPEASGIAALQEIYRSLRRDHRLPDNFLARMAALVRDSPEVALALLSRFSSGRSPAGKPSRIRLQCYLEQAPVPESRVVLSSRTDSLGLHLLAVDWHMTELELRSLRVLTETVRTEFARLGLGDVRPAAWLQQDGWEVNLADCAHHCGTTRIAADPSRGVADPDCMVFGIDGLYLGGSSVFPTSGYANPTLTIVSMAIRLADHLKGRVTAGAIQAGTEMKDLVHR